MNSGLTDGLSLMAIGMGTVLMFLCILIISMHIMSKVVIWLNKIFPEAIPATTGAKPVAASNDDAIAVAIAAALAKR